MALPSVALLLSFSASFQVLKMCVREQAVEPMGNTHHCGTARSVDHFRLRKSPLG